jgi:hypothetical protein
MATMATKNVPISGVGQDLGLGTTLSLQVQDALEEEKRRKALMGQSNTARELGLAPSTTLGAAGANYSLV